MDPKEAWSHTSWWWRWRLCFFVFFYVLPPVSTCQSFTCWLFLIIWMQLCCDRDADPPYILESDKVVLFALDYIITICKQDTVWLSVAGEGGCFLGKSSLKFGLGGLPVAVIFFKTVTITTQKWKEATLGELDRRTDTSPFIIVVFFSSHKLPKTLTVTTLLLFGHVTLLCVTFLFILLSEGPV